MKMESKDILFETEHYTVFLAPDQSYLGRCIVDLKENIGDLADLNDEHWIDFKKVVKTTELAIRKAFGAIMFNWTCLMNNAYKEENPKPHVHWHLRPRYKQKVEFEGVVFNDPDFGHHYDRTRKKEISEDLRMKIIEKIKENID